MRYYTRPELARAAAVYAALGYPVLPVFQPAGPGGCPCRDGIACRRAGKHSRIVGGVRPATTESTVVRRRWRLCRPPTWLVSALHHILKGAAADISSGRLDPSDAAEFIVATVLPACINADGP